MMYSWAREFGPWRVIQERELLTGSENSLTVTQSSLIHKADAPGTQVLTRL